MQVTQIGVKESQDICKIYLPYDKAYYSEATADTTVPSLPDIPQGSDLFPTGTQAIAKKDLILNSSKGLEDAVLTLEKGSTFTFLKKQMIIG